MYTYLLIYIDKSEKSIEISFKKVLKLGVKL